ncbi:MULTISPECIES: SprT-like domain-containing protein [Clostridium]|uniref:SprT-like domain-containing protein n=1 Tax=Clostridium frigoriphilum TaxID=443253 RepID=A0ABU7UUN3_9CLOT|nr:SprT-like domain-containing protein [Clostridium sp. DSM 17811]MBU3101917.1 SprT-like domain-containing protein [Clostridium sp. DSM 17811]
MISTDNFLLENAFNVFNKIYFDGSLPEVVITIQSSPKSYGYITVHKVWKDNKDTYHEINISAEHLTRDIENVLATLLHEMVHLYCMVNSIEDTSNGGRYHNKRFKAEAEKRNLIIEYVHYIGHSKTSPSKRFIGVLKENGMYTNIDHCRTNVNSLIVPPTGGANVSNLGKRKTSTRKYVCNECGINIRATRDVNIICGECMCVMIKMD